MFTLERVQQCIYTVSCSTFSVITQASPDIRAKSPDTEQPYPILAAVPPGVTAAKQE